MPRDPNLSESRRPEQRRPDGTVAQDSAKPSALGDSGSAEPSESSAHFFDEVYDQLHGIADRCVAFEPRLSVRATSLIHETYLRLHGDSAMSDRDQFLRFAAVTMRRILIERARHARRLKRGGDRRRVSLSRVDPSEDPVPLELSDLDDALHELESLRPGYYDIAVLRFLLGCSVEETARVLGMSRVMVVKNWKFARAWLATRLGPRR